MVFGDPAPLYRDYLPADLEADARSQNLVASVHVEAGWDRSDPVGETAWLSQLARTQRLPTVLVVYAPLDDPGSARCSRHRAPVRWCAASDSS